MVKILQFWLGMAVAYAFEFVTDTTRNVPAERLLQVITRGSSGRAAGLVGGQVVDLESEESQMFL